MASTHPVRYCDRCGTRLARDNRGRRCAGCSHSARDALLKPPNAPREFWDTRQMRDALATWHMGRVIFAYRTHPWHPRPLSQETVGNWLALTQAQLSRIENGRAPEELTKLVCWARTLRIPGELLWFKLPDEADDVTALPGQAPPAVTLPVLLHGRSVLLPIDMQAARANGLTSLLDELACGSVAHALPTSDLDELEHVAAALDDARRYLDGSVVGYFRQQLTRSKADDGNLGPARALPLVLGILGGSCKSRYSQPANSAPMAPSSPAGCTGTCKIRRARRTGMTAPWSGHRKPATPPCRATCCSRSPRWRTTCGRPIGS